MSHCIVRFSNFIQSFLLFTLLVFKSLDHVGKNFYSLTFVSLNPFPILHFFREFRIIRGQHPNFLENL